MGTRDMTLPGALLLSAYLSCTPAGMHVMHAVTRSSSRTPAKMLYARGRVSCHYLICYTVLGPKDAQHNQKLQCGADCAHNEVQHQEEGLEMGASIADCAAQYGKYTYSHTCPACVKIICQCVHTLHAFSHTMCCVPCVMI